MIVVSDTSPLNYLALIGVIDVLPKLFERVYVPPSVLEEMNRLKTPEVVRAWAISSPDWLYVVAPKARLPSTTSLGSGEADAISLALQIGTQSILIDERRGRRIAELEGMIPLPTLAILERAAADNLIEFRPVLARLLRTNIRLSQELIRGAIERDAARYRDAQ